MAFFKRIPKGELCTIWTCSGWFMGIAPVYITNIKGEEDMAPPTRSWVPELLFDVAEAFHQATCMLAGRYMPFAIKITGRIDGGKLLDSRGNLR